MGDDASEQIKVRIFVGPPIPIEEYLRRRYEEEAAESVSPEPDDSAQPDGVDV